MATDEPLSPFDLLWTPNGGAKRGRRPSLTREAVVLAAIDLADHEGLEAVTMQRLAAALKSKTMTLYRYLPGKGAVLDLMWDAALGSAPDLGEGDWRAKLGRWAAANFDRLEQHPWLIELVGSARSVGPRWAAWLDAGLAAQSALPFTASEKLAILTLVDGHLRSAARLRFGVKASSGWAADFGRMMEMAATGSSLPALRDMILEGDLAEPGLSLEEMGDFGLELILDGIAGLARAKGTAR